MISTKDIRLQLLNLANREGDIGDWIKSDLCNGEFSTLSKFKEIYRSGYKWRSTYDTEMILVNQCWSASRFYSDLQKAVNIFLDIINHQVFLQPTNEQRPKRNRIFWN